MKQAKPGHTLSSMTGYGRGSAQGEGFQLTVELRAVNGRYLEIRAKLPRPLAWLETQLRERMQGKIHRGVVDAAVGWQPASGAPSAWVNESVVRAYLAEIDRLSTGARNTTVDLASVLRLPGAVLGEDAPAPVSEKLVGKLLADAMDAALANLQASRLTEGAKLAEAVARELSTLEKRVDEVKRARESAGDRYREKVRTRVERALADARIRTDESRLLQEVAFYADRSDITEELDRLASHLQQLESALAASAEGPVGKRLDVLTQECLREANTIGAKADDISITQQVMEIKLGLERIREQVQNIE